MPNSAYAKSASLDENQFLLQTLQSIEDQFNELRLQVLEDPSIVERAVATSQRWPHLPPGAVGAVAFGFVSPEHIDDFAAAVARLQADDTLGQRADQKIKTGGIGGDVSGFLEQAARPFESGSSFLARNTLGNLAEFAGDVGNVAAPVIGEDSPLGRGLERSTSIITDPVIEGSQAIVRGATTFFDAAWNELVTRPYRAARIADNRYQDETGRAPNILSPGYWAGWAGELPEAHKDAGASAGVIALNKVLEGGSPELGTGWLPGGQSYVEAIQQQEQVLHNGHPISMGRDFADIVGLEYDTTNYNVVSGLFDFSTQIRLDPTIVAAGPLVRAGEARRGAGLIDGVRRGVLPEVAIDNFLLGTPRGRRTINWLRDESSFKAIFDQTNQAAVSRRLVDAASDDEVIAILRETLGRELAAPPRVPHRGGTEGLVVYRSRESLGYEKLIAEAQRLGEKPFPLLGEWLPQNTAVLTNPNDAVEQVMRWGINARLPRAEFDAALYRFASELENPGVYTSASRGTSSGQQAAIKIFMEDIVRDQLAPTLRQAGNDEDVVAGLVRIFSDEIVAPQRVKVGNRTVSRSEALAQLRRGDITQSEFDRLFFDYPEGFQGGYTTRAYFYDQQKSLQAAIGGGGPVHAQFPGQRVIQYGDEAIPMPTPHMDVEYLDAAIPLPNVRDIRRATGKITRMVNSGAMEAAGLRGAGRAVAQGGWNTIDALWSLQRNIWTPLMLISRIAWPVRITGEGQARIAANGQSSLFSHPIDYLAYALGRKGSLTLGDEALRQTDELQKALPRQLRHFFGPDEITAKNHDWVGSFKNANRQTHLNAWEIEMSKHWRSPLSQRTAQALLDDSAESIDDLKAWFFDGEGASIRLNMNDNLMDFQGYQPSDALVAREQADEFIDTMVTRVHQATGDDADLLASIANRQLTGLIVGDTTTGPLVVGSRVVSPDRGNIGTIVDIRGDMADVHFWNRAEGTRATVTFRLDSLEHPKPRATNVGDAAIPKQARKTLEEKLDEFAPDFLPVPRGVSDAAERSRLQRLWDSATSRIWYALGSWPESNINRIPLFKQMYVKAITDMVPYASDDALEEIGRWARKNNLNRAERAAIARGASLRTQIVPEVATDSRLLAIRDEVIALTAKHGTEFPEYADDVHRLRARVVDAHFDELSDDAARYFEFEAHYTDLESGARGQGLVQDVEGGRVSGSHMYLLDESIDDLAEPVRALLEMDELDQLARTRALQGHNDLLYNLAEKGQTAEALRLVFPFMEAYKEIISTWAKIFGRRPQMVRRAQQLIQGARRSGFFYQDPTSGREMFAYPGGQELASFFGEAGGLLPEQVAGSFGPITDAENIRVTLPASVEGVNLAATTVIPGVGPAVAILAGAFLPDSPEWHELRRLILPFGSEIRRPGDLTNPDRMLKQITPAWVKKAITRLSGPEFDEALYNGTVIDAMRALALTGEYEGPEDLNRMYKDAVAVANKILVARAGGQQALPTGFRIDFRVKPDSPDAEEQMRVILGDEARLGKHDDGYFSMVVLSNVYHTLLQETGDDYETMKQMMDLLGYDAEDWSKLFFVGSLGRGKTVALAERADTEPGILWEKENEHLFTELPSTIGFFAPESAVQDDFSLAARFQHLDEGDRVSITGEEFIRLVNQKLGRAIYSYQRSLVEDQLNQPATRAWLSELRERLDQQFPYWQFENPTVPGGREPRERMDELEHAVTLPEILATPQGEALNTYLGKREQVLDQIIDGFDDISTRSQAEQRLLSANSTSAQRSWLRQWGERLSREVPEFQGIWTSVLEGEVDAE